MSAHTQTSCLPVILGKLHPSGRGSRERMHCAIASCRNDNQVLALEHQVCAIHKGRRGPDRLSSEPCSNGASSRNPPKDSLSPVGISFLQEGEDCQNAAKQLVLWDHKQTIESEPWSQKLTARRSKALRICWTLKVNHADLPCRLQRLITLVQVSGVDEAGGSIFKCASAPVDMTEQMNSGLLLFDRVE
jgi:hypothetical protein